MMDEEDLDEVYEDYVYICYNCDKTFKEPVKFETTYEALFGVASEFPDSHKVIVDMCPYCRASGTFDKIEHPGYTIRRIEE